MFPVPMLRCPHCRYDLTATFADRAECTCSECGARWTVKQLNERKRWADAAWVVWFVSLFLSGFVLWTFSVNASRRGVAGLDPRAAVPGTSLEVRDAAAIGSPILWAVIAIVAAFLGARWLRRNGQRGGALSMSVITILLVLLGGGAWTLFGLFARAMRGMGPL